MVILEFIGKILMLSIGFPSAFPKSITKKKYFLIISNLKNNYYKKWDI